MSKPNNKNTGIRSLDLDGWRGLSILAVIIGHFFAQQGINVGRLGVEMFFVLSGRLMAEILFLHHTDLSRFFRRRITRVWSALFVFIILMWTVSILLLPALSLSTSNTLSALTFTYNYAIPYIGRNPNIDHIWSLCVEEHIYILLGLIAYLTRRFHLNSLAIIGLLTLIFMINGLYRTLNMGLGYYEVYWRSDVRGASILASVFVYFMFQKNKTAMGAHVPIFFAFLGVLLNTNLFPDTIKYSIGSVCLAVAVSSITNLPSKLKSVLTNPAITYLGLISFSLYLWQQPFYQQLGHVPRYQLLAAVFVLATLSYLYIEKPSRQFLNHIWAK